MKPTAYIFTVGIKNDPKDPHGWTDVTVDKMYSFTKKDILVIRQEYPSGALFRRLDQEERGRRLAWLIDDLYRGGYRIVISGHSNGADVDCRAIRLIRQDTVIDQVHLIAGACESDMRDNHLNFGLLSDRVKDVYVYFSNKDEVLNKLARKSRWFKWMGIGYGLMGLEGPKGINKTIKDRVHPIEDNRQNHMSWVGENLDHTLKKILRTK